MRNILLLTIALAFAALLSAGEAAVWPVGHTGDGTEGKSDPATTPGHGMAKYTVVAGPGLKVLGAGYLCPEAPAGDVRDRHMAGIGAARVVWGNAGATCWGNRVFIRNNGCLWCIGAPAKPYLAPEAALTP